MKPVLVSGIQPTGKLHIGNYLGSLKNFVELQNSGKYQCYFFIADLHSLTEDFDPKEKSKQILNVALDYLAAGLNPEKSTIFVQSEIPAHSELAIILNNFTPFGELERMTQFKDKASISQVLTKLEEDFKNRKEGFTFNMLLKEFEAPPMSLDEKSRLLEMFLTTMGHALANRSSANAGLFDYPVLMASDILLYDAAVVPVGDDQVQHLELTRTLARKFNSRFGKTFIEPKPLLTKASRIMSLDDPGKKMSKSSPAGCLFIDDEPETIKDKLKRAVTDSGREVKYDETNKPAVSNLILIYSALSGLSIKEVEKKFEGKGYGDFKNELAEVVVKSLAPFQKKKKELAKKPAAVKKILASGNKKAGAIARKKIEEIKGKIGLPID